MRFNEFDFFITEAFIGMKRSSLMSILTIITITVSLIVFGIFLLLTINLNNMMNFLVSKLEIRAFLVQDLSDNRLNSLIQKIERLKEVKTVTFITKENAWENLSKQFSNISFIEVIEDNPLPNSLKIVLYDTTKTRDVASYLKTQKEIEDITYGGIAAERISLFAAFTKYTGLILVILLTIATLFIIVNTIRLTVIARQDEITIMHLVGATDSFIKLPFIIEGLIMGVIASIIAIVFIKTAYLFFAIKLQENIPYFPLVFHKNILYILYFIIFLTGTLIGVFGAYLSTTQSLKRSKNG
ncbi:MAG: permease-like cell division protein FtsX [Candidatus Margulisiibacteriota bacterium]|jgi:cell division transport system permease protein